MAAQQKLPIDATEPAWAERESDIGLLICKFGWGLHERELLLKILAIEKRCRAPLEKTYEQLAERPWGLCCSPSKAYRIVSNLKYAGVIKVEERRYVTGSLQGNSYSIDWEGVKAALDCRRPGRRPSTLADRQFDERSSQDDERSSQDDERSSQDDDHTKEYSPLLPLSNSPPPPHSSPAVALVRTSKTARRVPPAGYEAAEAELVAWGFSGSRIHEILLRVSRTGETPSAFLERFERGKRAIAVPANAGLFERPEGALAYFLETGKWPTASRIVDPDAAPSKPSEAQRVAREEKASADALFLAKRMRAQGFSDGKIKAAQRQRGLPELLPYRRGMSE